MYLVLPNQEEFGFLLALNLRLDSLLLHFPQVPQVQEMGLTRPLNNICLLFTMPFSTQHGIRFMAL